MGAWLQHDKGGTQRRAETFNMLCGRLATCNSIINGATTTIAAISRAIYAGSGNIFVAAECRRKRICAYVCMCVCVHRQVQHNSHNSCAENYKNSKGNTKKYTCALRSASERDCEDEAHQNNANTRATPSTSGKRKAVRGGAIPSC